MMNVSLDNENNLVHPLSDLAITENHFFADPLKSIENGPANPKLPPDNLTSEPNRLAIPQQPSQRQGKTSNLKKTSKSLHSAAGRKVTFPEELKVVKHIMEPRFQWNQVSQCSTEELIQAYQESCFLHKSTPFKTIMEQLRNLTPQKVGERFPILSFRGLRLTIRDIETLESILSRVQFHTMDFEGTNLDDDMAISIFEMIEFYSSCTRLNISANSRLGPRAYNVCSKMLRKTQCMDVLVLRNIAFSDSSLTVLSRAIRLGSHLTQLCLDQCNMCGRNLLILVSALKINETLRELYLVNCNLSAADGIQLGAMLKFNRFLTLLDLRNNNLCDMGISHISDGLFEQTRDQMGSGRPAASQGLTSLILWNNGVTHLAMIAMSQALRRCAFLETLNLGRNTIGSEGAHALREGLLYNKSLLRLLLPSCKISCEGAVALAEVIADTRQLERLDLRENDIRTGGLIALSHALRMNDSVVRLDLDQELKKEPNVPDYQATQQAYLDMIRNSLKNNSEKARQRQEKLREMSIMLEGEEEKESSVEMNGEEELTSTASTAENNDVCVRDDDDDGDLSYSSSPDPADALNAIQTNDFMENERKTDSSGLDEMEEPDDATAAAVKDEEALMEQLIDSEIDASPLSQRLKHIHLTTQHFSISTATILTGDDCIEEEAVSPREVANLHLLDSIVPTFTEAEIASQTES